MFTVLGPCSDSKDSVIDWKKYLQRIRLNLMQKMLQGIQVVLTYCTSTHNKKFIEKILTPRKPINRTTSLTSTDVYFRPNVSLSAPLYVSDGYILGLSQR